MLCVCSSCKAACSKRLHAWCFYYLLHQRLLVRERNPFNVLLPGRGQLLYMINKSRARLWFSINFQLQDVCWLTCINIELISWISQLSCHPHSLNHVVVNNITLFTDKPKVKLCFSTLSWDHSLTFSFNLIPRPFKCSQLAFKLGISSINQADLCLFMPQYVC